MSELDDAALARLAEVFRRDARWVHSILRRFGVDKGEAEDVTQEVFLVLRSRLADVAHGDERKFLFRTAAYLAANARRAARRRPAALQETTREPVSNRNAERELAEHAELALLQEILDAMSDDLRAAFILFEIEEMTVTEIAAILSIPLGTVKSRLLRARQVFEREARRRGVGQDATGASDARKPQ
ncbi:RNA polymerase sigma factor RpoE [Labilithrix luteola]|uniref:RNA polymerase sigma factor RpoE n=2 Tax=Labilithrix luteola TaxID=1391654 RepID=A0A0K1QA98_9BACT|nr:RNA polymerase sigma factor RpoE [Labilithrix luteola]